MLPWIFLLLSLGAWWIVFTTRSMVELALALLAALVFLLLGFFGLLSARVGHVARTQAAREKALLLTTRPTPAADPTRAARADARDGSTAGPDAGGAGPAGRGGPRAGARDDEERDGGGDAGSGDGGGGGGGGGD